STILKTRIVLGAHDSEFSPEPVHISKITVHPQFDYEIRSNDIALLKLQVPAKLQQNVNLLCLPTSRDIAHPNQMAVVAGWGNHTDPCK
ncbi:chymotrypsin B, partial [Nephila pilipes]